MNLRTYGFNVLKFKVPSNRTRSYSCVTGFVIVGTIAGRSRCGRRESSEAGAAGAAGTARLQLVQRFTVHNPPDLIGVEDLAEQQLLGDAVEFFAVLLEHVARTRSSRSRSA